MPAYDFRCNQCSHEYEENVPYSKREQVQCPICGSTDKKQIFKAGTVKGTLSGSSCGPAGSGFT